VNAGTVGALEESRNMPCSICKYYIQPTPPDEVMGWCEVSDDHQNTYYECDCYEELVEEDDQ
jgi:hypothetical protein